VELLNWLSLYLFRKQVRLSTRDTFWLIVQIYNKSYCEIKTAYVAIRDTGNFQNIWRKQCCKY